MGHGAPQFDVPSDALSATLATPALRDPAFQIEMLPECDSTNALLLGRAAANAPSGTVLTTESQTAGRGRRGRGWVAPPGTSLPFSLLWRFGLPPARLTGLSLCVGLAVARGLHEAGAHAVRLKWPNDLVVPSAAAATGYAKLGGILIELQTSPHGTAAIIGIGINVAFHQAAREAAATSGTTITDVTSVCGRGVPRNALLARLLEHLHGALHDFAQHGLLRQQSAWNALHLFHGKPVAILEEGRLGLRGTVAGIAPSGALLLDTPEGRHEVVSGDVSLRPTAHA